MPVILQCPVCRSPLLNAPDGFQCSNNHAFDMAREGYVNLLLAHQKNSKQPGDSKEMIRSRTRFLELGLYNRISDGVNSAVAACLPVQGNEGMFTILDAGCGEGFYLARLKTFLGGKSATPAEFEYYGVDISKFGVRRAAKRDRTINWFVAGIRNLPFAGSSLDVIVNVFSPIDVEEFWRVLRQDGMLVTVTPGPQHLNGLRKVIYAKDAREHAASTITREAGSRFSLSSEERITYLVELQNREAIMDLLAMTPYYWNIDRATMARVEALDRLALDVDVEIRTFRKKRVIEGQHPGNENS
jgi:23S rRNA (guanine745-N1)-methyltransferase